MKIGVIGTGYVGLVTGACLADLGHVVVCMDKDTRRVKLLKKGEIPFYEPGLSETVKRSVKGQRLFFTSKLEEVILDAEVIFIAVGTPPKANGEADVSAVIDVAEGIAKVLKKNHSKSSKSELGYKVIVNKSTVPVGMGDIVTDILKKRGIPEKKFAVVSNPEFLKEGSAVSDFMHPDRIVVGASNNRAFNLLSELYRPLNAHIIFTSIKSAELIKYASNAFLATRISFMNEIANICEKVGSDVVEVAEGMGLDKRIGKAFLNAGIGYGGSCFPKDVVALLHLAQSHGYDSRILEAANQANEEQWKIFVEKVEATLGGADGKRIAVLGLSFKPETDDTREAPSIKIIKRLIDLGAEITAYDPVVKKVVGLKLRMAANPYDAVKGKQAVIMVTEWNEFKQLDLERVKSLLKEPVVIDGRNIYSPVKMRNLGFTYVSVGRS
ncbi:MAG: UDP-glucose/GDP-mannose dehydrogenase family protein [Candidatus Saganbacteria bacterium]|nr:UDP-glucose/GDP-mannose dehydrogenase family protein [Candidatus Saganbacteria bacterium]